MLNKSIALRFNPSVCFATSFFRRHVGVRNIVSGAGHWLASVLKKHGLPFIFLNTAFYKSNIQNVREELKRLKYKNIRIVAISLYNDNLEETIVSLREIRKILPDAWIVAGGPLVNGGNFEDLAKLLPEVDCFMRGDSEYPFLRLAKVLLKAKRQEKLNRKAQAAVSRIKKGIYFRHFDFVHKREGVNVLSQRSFNGFELFWQIQELIEDIKENNGLHLNTRRGCKYRCIFCSHQYRRPVAWTSTRIIEELRRIKGLVESGILPSEARNIFFDDDDFFQNPVRAKNFLRKLAKDNELNSFFGFKMLGSVSSFLKKNGDVDEKLVELLSRVRRKEVGLGTDAFCDSELGFLGKSGYNYEQIQKLVEVFERYRISNTHFVVLTSNQTTSETLLDNLSGMLTLLNAFPAYFRLAIENNVLVLHPGSILGNLAEEGRAGGEVLYHYAYRGIYYGVVVTDDEVVRSFLKRISTEKFKYKDDIKRLSRKLDLTSIRDPEYFITSSIIGELRELSRSTAADEYYLGVIATISNYYLNLFVVRKMLGILTGIMSRIMLEAESA